VHLLTAGDSPHVGHDDRFVTVTAPSVEIHEVIAVDLA
jgi:hypothetical protein